MCIESGDTKAPDRKTAGEKPDAGLLNEGPLSSPPPNVPTIFTSQLPLTLWRLPDAAGVVFCCAKPGELERAWIASSNACRIFRKDETLKKLTKLQIPQKK